MKKIFSFIISLILTVVMLPFTNALSLGDVDGTAGITTADARLILRASIGLQRYSKGSDIFAACDIDGDGTISTGDARTVLRIAIGLDRIDNYQSDDVGSKEQPADPPGGYSHGVYVPGLVNDGVSYNYIVNTNTLKFHVRGCRALSKMNSGNRAYSAATRSELVADGFSPCGICKP